ncbi:hypothetical protein ACIPL1_24330 [Pseudomonas sp. NPDC090202]|uniref:hypothetical protein n=1 Tax=unclassified Pseudomonas TaxID=196821 RepID=UPI00380F0085
MNWVEHEGDGRYQVLRFVLGEQEFVLLGAYFPALNKKNLSSRREHAALIEAFIRHTGSNENRCVLFGGDINEIPPWHVPRIFDYTVEGFPIHGVVTRSDLSDLARDFLPENSYSWFDRHGNGQLLDGMFISARYKSYVDKYYLLRETLDLNLSDHSGLVVRLSYSISDS